MGFLDFDGLSHFFEKVVSYTRSAYKAGDGVTINECKINVDVPVYGVYAKDSFDELPKETQNKGLYVVTDGMVSLSEIENAYSTEETRIGTWIDGKPLYRKVLSYTISNADTSYRILMPHNSNIIVVNIDGRIMGELEGTQILFTVPTGSVISGTFQSLLVYNNNGLAFATTNSMFVGATLYAIIEYTKTTD